MEVSRYGLGILIKRFPDYSYVGRIGYIPYTDYLYPRPFVPWTIRSVHGRSRLWMVYTGYKQSLVRI